MDDFEYAELPSPPRSVTDQEPVGRITTPGTIHRSFLDQVQRRAPELTDKQRNMFCVVALHRVINCDGVEFTNTKPVAIE